MIFAARRAALALAAAAPRPKPCATYANAGRLAANVIGGLAAIYWFGLGLTGFFAAIAVGFCLYAVLLVFAVTRVTVPYQPQVAAAATP